jgi:hypothetical protein
MGEIKIVDSDKSGASEAAEAAPVSSRVSDDTCTAIVATGYGMLLVALLAPMIAPDTYWPWIADLAAVFVGLPMMGWTAGAIHAHRSRSAVKRAVWTLSVLYPLVAGAALFFAFMLESNALATGP